VTAAQHAADLDSQLAAALRQSRWLVRGIAAVLVLLLLASLAVSGYLLHQSVTERGRVEAEVFRIEATACAFNYDLGTAPLPADAKALGVKIILDSRDRYAGLDCRPPLPPPPAGLRRLAAKYGLTISH
jgi:hypothetical protein